MSRMFIIPHTSSNARAVALAGVLVLLSGGCSSGELRSITTVDWSTCRAAIGWPLRVASESGMVVNVDPSPAHGMTAAGDSLLAFDRYGIGLAVRTGDGEGRRLVAASSALALLPVGAPTYLLASGPYVDWIHRVSDTIAALDGARVQLILDDGGRTESLASLGPLVPRHMLGSSSRIRVVSDGVLLDIQLTSREGSRRDRTFELWHLSKARARRVFRMALAPLPTSGPAGTAFLGPDEARPIWDGAGDCFVVSDGHRPVVLMGTLADGVVDSLELPLGPLVPQPEAVRALPESANIADSVLAGLRPAPALRRRVSAMVLTPDAELWITPLRAGSGPGRVHVLQVLLAERSVREDTLVVFPRAFMRSGSVAGVRWERGAQPQFTVVRQ